MHFFALRDDPDAALTKYNEEKNDLHTVRKPKFDPKCLCGNAIGAVNESEPGA
jgi:hypothetical protein